MASKTVTFTSIQIESKLKDDEVKQGTFLCCSTGPTDAPDPYLFFRSQHATVGGREAYVAATAKPYFDGPFQVFLGGPVDPEQVDIELWDRDENSADDLMEVVKIDLAERGSKSSGSFELSNGGKITLSWEIDGRVQDPTGNTEKGPLTIKRAGMRDFDGAAGVRSYLILKGKSRAVASRWEAQEALIWEQERRLVHDPQGYIAELWERASSGDIQLRAGEVTFAHSDGKEATTSVRFSRGGVLEFTFSVDLPSKEPAKPHVVVRKEIRKMSDAEQKRFVAALKKTMENTNGPQSSEYFRIAGYHGWPTDWCHHGEETFPGWHRGYNCELEQALIKADKALGNDGNIGLPYWDWTQLEIKGEVFPKIIREHFGELPKDLVNPSEAGPLGTYGYSRIRDDAALRAELTGAQVAHQATQCLAVSEHWMHASTRFNRQGFSVESPHNSVHVCCGFPMTSQQYAAFHPIFFLHHCNVDRIYEKHVQMETPEECAQEFLSVQTQLQGRGERNRFQTPLAPFNHPLKPDEPLMPADTLDVEKLGYRYDELPPTPAMAMHEEPVFAAFKNLKVLDLEYKSYMLHVFVIPKGTAEWATPEGGPTAWRNSANYAGSGAIFGGKKDCPNCKQREPYNVLVEIQETLTRLGLSRHRVNLKVMCEDGVGDILPLEQTPVPHPIIVGPLFEDMKGSLSEQAEGLITVATEVENLVREKGCGPILVRLSWHDAAAFMHHKGGCPNAAVRLPDSVECTDDRQKGLPDVAVPLLKEISDKYVPGVLSHADLWALAANVSIRVMGGPDIPTRFGRPDAKSAADGVDSLDGRIPDGDKGAKHLRDIFRPKGFDDREIVALSGAHTVGKCHLDRTGFEGPWTENTLLWDNSYFKDLLTKKYDEETTSAGYKQNRCPVTGTMMLVSDLALVQDASLKKHVEEYAKDQNLWFADFTKAWIKLQENGVEQYLRAVPSLVPEDGEAKQLQTALKQYGFYEGQLDGKFGPRTKKAVEDYQKFSGLVQDGVAGPITKAMLIKPRNDMNPDVSAAASKTRPLPFEAGSTVFYSVGTLPGYLNATKAFEEIEEAFSQWGTAMGVTFELSATPLRSRIHVQFADLSSLGEGTDGIAKPGGQLAEATPQGVTLDEGERWLLRGQSKPARVSKAFKLYTVLLHELGHCIGLSHSSYPEDVMWPYYREDPERPELSAADKARAQGKVVKASDRQSKSGGCVLS